MPPIRPCGAASASFAREALQRVFLGAPTPSYPPTFLIPALRPILSGPSAQQRRGAKRRATDDTEELLAKAAAAGAPKSGAGARGPPNPRGAPGARGVLRWAHPDRDEGINSAFVIVLEGESKELAAPRALRDVLQSIDRKEYFVVRVGQAAPEASEQRRPQRPTPTRRDGSDVLAGSSGAAHEPRRFAPAPPGERGWPLVRIMPRKEVFLRDQARDKNERKQAQKAKRADGKTVELGWTMADGDLAHRMRKAREILEDYGRVSIVIDKKRRRDVIDPDVASSLLDKALASVAEVPGAKESRRDGKIGETIKVVFDKADKA